MTVKLSLTGLNKLRYLDSGLQEPAFEAAVRKDKTRYLIVAVEPVQDIKTRGNVDDETKLTTELRVVAVEPAYEQDDEDTLIEYMGQMNKQRTHLFREDQARQAQAARGDVPGQEEIEFEFGNTDTST
jgi:hypothetical protein